tara:strand:+ start:420 stop:740 length:321 start_codon:yes stop_codon:yes gene_type:complete
MKMRREPTDRRNTRLTAVVLLTGIAGNVEGEAAWWRRQSALFWRRDWMRHWNWLSRNALRFAIAVMDEDVRQQQLSSQLSKKISNFFIFLIIILERGCRLIVVWLI